MNPGDFVVSIAGHSFVDASGNIPTTKALSVYFSHSQSDIDMIELLDKCEETIPEEEYMFELFNVYPTPRWYQISLLTQRYLIKTIRNRRPVRIGFIRHILVGLLYGKLLQLINYKTIKILLIGIRRGYIL